MLPMPITLLRHLPLLLLPTLAFGWNGTEHAQITAEAVRVMPEEMAAILAPEAGALTHIYCEFPDQNWPAYGQWGDGNAEPYLPRFADTRREWDISFYCGWNPVTREGTGYPHSTPRAYEAVPKFFLRAVEAWKAGQLEDGARFLGVAMHYIEDSAAFGHLQAVHRSFHWDTKSPLNVGNYSPQKLGDTPEQAAEQLVARMKAMVEITEKAVDPIVTKLGMPMAEVKRLSKDDPYPKEAVRAVMLAKLQSPAEMDAAARTSASAAAHVCADMLLTALSFAPKPFPQPKPNATGVNLVFNPSFENAGDENAEGWCIGWLDLSDKTGRAEWYRAGTHWDKPVKQGERSAMVLWAPEKGIEWRQTWRNAVRVSPGEVYRASAWVKSRTEKGRSHLTLELSDTNYHAIAQPISNVVEGKGDWTELKLETTIPPNARWLRVMLHSNADGAAWFDEVSVERIID